MFCLSVFLEREKEKIKYETLIGILFLRERRRSEESRKVKGVRRIVSEREGPWVTQTV
jgi:hypothetical protein